MTSLAQAIAADPAIFSRGASLEDAIAKLRALPGIGEWTAQYIAMRELREPDAFPAADIGLLRAMAVPDGRRPSPAELLARAERWRPWRAYAALASVGRGSPAAGLVRKNRMSAKPPEILQSRPAANADRHRAAGDRCRTACCARWIGKSTSRA